MRTFRILTALTVTSILTLTACHPDKPENPRISANKTTLNETSAEGRDSIQVSSNVDWSITGAPSWLTVSPASGSKDDKVLFTYGANTATDARSASLTLTGKNVNVAITLNQQGSTPSLMADKTTLTELPAGQLDSVTITSNVPWSLSIPTTATFITAAPLTGTAGTTKIKFTLAANTTAGAKTTNLSVASTGATTPPITLAVSQAQADVTLTNFTPLAKGGESITLTGSGFSTTASENTVKINNHEATVTAATTTSLTVTVPAKAGDGPVNVSVGQKSATTTSTFTYDWVAVVSTLAGSVAGHADGSVANATFDSPAGIAIDANRNLYICDKYINKIRKISSEGVVTTFAGDGTANYKDGVGAGAQFNYPNGIAIDPRNGLIYVADQQNNRIRKITPDGVVTTIAGDGTQNYKDGVGTSAQINSPVGITVDENGFIYVADLSNRIRKITPTGEVSTIAGDGTANYKDGTGINAEFNQPFGLSIDGNENIYVLDDGDNRVRKIASDGVVTTVAGDGNIGNKDELGIKAEFAAPFGLALDNNGNIFVTDNGNHNIRRITKDGMVKTIAGNSSPGSTDGIGTLAKFEQPFGIAIDNTNSIIYVTDISSHKIRKITLQ